MKIKFLLLTALLLTVVSVGFAQSKTKAGYIGSWSIDNGRGNLSMDVSATKIVVMDPPRAAQTYKFRDITGKSGETYYLQFTGSVKNSPFGKFVSISVDKSAKPNQMTVTEYKSLADMQAGKNPQFEPQKWTRDSETGSAESSTEQATILKALSVPVSKDLKQKITFSTRAVNVQGNWAFVAGQARNDKGDEPNWKLTEYQKRIDVDAFEDNLFALLKQKNGKWSVITYMIGCTDVCYLDWNKQYKAPKAIFE